MRKQLVDAYVIHTTIYGVKKYLTSYSLRPDNSILPSGWSDDPDQSHTWNSQTAVEKAIAKIHNIHDRKMQWEKRTVLSERPSKILNNLNDLS